MTVVGKVLRKQLRWMMWSVLHSPSLTWIQTAARYSDKLLTAASYHTLNATIRIRVQLILMHVCGYVCMYVRTQTTNKTSISKSGHSHAHMLATYLLTYVPLKLDPPGLDLPFLQGLAFELFVLGCPHLLHDAIRDLQLELLLMLLHTTSILYCSVSKKIEKRSCLLWVNADWTRLDWIDNSK